MSEPRRSTRARAREEAAPAPEPPKETPIKGAKSTLKRKRPSVVPKESTPSTPANESVPPEPKQTLPLRIVESQPLPTLPEPQPLELPSSEWQDIQQSGVLSASLERSRAVWISGVNFRVFHKFFIQPKKPADRTEEDKAKYQRQKDLYKNFPELGKDINNTKESIEVQAQLVIEPHTFPIRLYAPREIIKHTQKKIAPPMHAYGQWPNHSQPQHSQPNQYTQYNNHGQPMYQHKPPPPRPPPPKPVQKAPTPTPGPASTPAPDPVIHALAQRAGVDPELKAVMKIVANGNASKQQLEFFQGHINELTAMLAKQKDDPAAQKPAQASSTPSGSAPSASKPTVPQSTTTTTPRPSQPLPSAPKFTPPVSVAKPVTPAPQSNVAKPTTPASPMIVTKTPTPAPSTNVTKAPTPAPPANVTKPPTPGPSFNATKPTTPSPAPNAAKPATPAPTSAAPVVPAPVPPRPVQPAQPTQPPQLIQQAPKPYSPMPPPGHMHQPPAIRQPHPPYQHGYNPPPHQQYHPPRQMQYAPPPPPTGYRPLVFSFEEGNKDLLHFPSYSFMEWLPNMSGAKFSFLVTKMKPKPEKETVIKPPSTPAPKPIEQAPQGVAPNPASSAQMPNSTVGAPAGTPGAVPPPTPTPSTPSTYLPPPRIEDFDEEKDIADIEFYQPVTVLLLTENNDIRQALLRAIRPPDVVERYMDEVFDKCKRAEETYLAFRLPRDGEVEIQPEKRFKSGDATPVVATPTHDNGFSSGTGFALQNPEKRKAGRPRKSLV